MFDMDGLLLDTERVCRDAFIQTVDEFEIPDHIDPDLVFQSMVGLRSADSNAAFTRALGAHVNAETFNPIWDKRIDAELNREVPVKPGAMALFQQLTMLQIPIGVVTSTKTDRARHHLHEAGLLAFVSDIVGGDLVKSGKPDPEGYIKMASVLGHAPENCAAFEDSNTGIRAAVASGARAVQVPDLVPPTAEVRALGHHIANDLLAGAKQVGLIP